MRTLCLPPLIQRLHWQGRLENGDGETTSQKWLEYLLGLSAHFTVCRQLFMLPIDPLDYSY